MMNLLMKTKLVFRLSYQQIYVYMKHVYMFTHQILYVIITVDYNLQWYSCTFLSFF